MSAFGGAILLSSEAEAYVDALDVIPLKDVGSSRWSKQHEYIEKLNMQAVLRASSNEDEYIKELLIQHEKDSKCQKVEVPSRIEQKERFSLIEIPGDSSHQQLVYSVTFSLDPPKGITFYGIPVLISDLICTEVWQQKVFSIIQRMDFEPHTTIPLYISLYHEATMVNLLETILYHKEPCEAAGDCILDVIDYCHRKITCLISKQESGYDDDEEIVAASSSNIQELKGMEELKKQDRKLQFNISIKAVSILRYITDHIADLSLSITSRILNTNDFPCLLVQLIEIPPWTLYRNGVVKKFIDGKWQTVPSSDSLRLTKMEGQVWIALYNLLMGPSCQEKYQFNSHNKAQILKLRAHLSEVVLDQIPSLCDLQRYLSHLSMMEPPAMKTGLVLEQVPEIRDGVLRANEGKWAAIAKHQVKTVFNPSTAAMKEQAKRFAETYSLDVLENLITEPPKCALCGELATKRCSRCQNEWYCRRECQVKHWSKHKQACILISEAQQAIIKNGKT